MKPQKIAFYMDAAKFYSHRYDIDTTMKSVGIAIAISLQKISRKLANGINIC